MTGVTGGDCVHVAVMLSNKLSYVDYYRCLVCGLHTAKTKPFVGATCRKDGVSALTRVTLKRRRNMETYQQLPKTISEITGRFL